MAATKTEIRQSVIAGRKKLSAEQVACFSSAICRTLETEFLDKLLIQQVSADTSIAESAVTNVKADSSAADSQIIGGHSSDLVADSGLVSLKSKLVNAHSKAANVLVYDAINNEVDLAEFVAATKAKGASVFKPFIVKDQKGIMQFASVDEDIDPLGKYDAGAFDSVDPADVDLVVCPLVAFDENCNRLGYGGGFYDRYLEKLPASAVVVGVAYEMQKVADLPLDEHDKSLSAIITEKQIYTH